MVKIELTRDQSLTTKDWLNYMVKLARAKLSITGQADQQWIANVVAISLMEDIELKFEKKLLDKKPKQFKYSLSYAHAAYFMVHLLALPIPGDQQWYLILRQNICNDIHQQIFSMHQEPAGDNPFTVSHFIEECLSPGYYE